MKCVDFREFALFFPHIFWRIEIKDVYLQRH